MKKTEKINELLSRGVDSIIKREDLEKKLASGKKLRIKLGIDPTSPNIHIGRAVVLWKLRAFQDLGHTVVFIVGDFTGLIGDTSDKDSERPMLTVDQVRANLRSYFEQAGKIIDKRKAEMHYNSKWLKKLGFLEIGKMADAFGLHEFSSRELIKRRMDLGKRVSLRELLYPLMQGYDSVAVRADVELGGTDQHFNLLAGRVIQPLYGQAPQNIMTMQLLEGTDGRKMSSSWGNVVNIVDMPNEMFGKVMSVSDTLLEKYFLLATRLPLQQIAKIFSSHANPRDQKMALAKEIVDMYYGSDKAEAAEQSFISQFSNKELPVSIPRIKVPKGSYKTSQLLVIIGFANSKTEARKLLEQNGVKVGGQTVQEGTIELHGKDALVVQVGKRRFAQLN